MSSDFFQQREFRTTESLDLNLSKCVTISLSLELS